MLLLLWTGLAGGASEPPAATPTLPQSGVRNKKRRWAVRDGDKYHYFDDLRKLHAFVTEVEKSEIIIPKQVRKAAKVDVKVLSGPDAYADFDRIRRMAEGEYDDDEDVEILLLYG